ncbi:MAG: hypothetical protein WBN41_05345 [Lysobacterales bacterium]
MNTIHRTRRLTLGLLTICGLAISISVSAKNPKEVSFEIENSKLEVKSNKTENGCKYFGSKRGCIKLDKGEKSEIYFHLKGNLDCSLESGTKWALNAVYLGGFNSSAKPRENAYGFDSISQANFDKVNADFNIVNRTSGLVANVDKSDKKITINDLNQHEYEVWYKVEAICPREDGGTPWTASYDPRVKNGGAD